eukprot:1154262-Rhodomonas_salina.1
MAWDRVRFAIVLVYVALLGEARTGPIGWRTRVRLTTFSLVRLRDQNPKSVKEQREAQETVADAVEVGRAQPADLCVEWLHLGATSPSTSTASTRVNALGAVLAHCDSCERLEELHHNRVLRDGTVRCGSDGARYAAVCDCPEAILGSSFATAFSW